MKENSSQSKSHSELARLKKLIELMKEHDLAGIGARAARGVKLRRREDKGNGGSMWIPTMAPAPGAGHAAAPGAPGETAPGGAEATGGAGPAASREGLVELKSPIVGTFYRAASPDKEAFVDKGTRVKPESVVCIIEAMKVMNEIRAEIAGEIVEILARNGEAVEFNQPLFLIRP